MFEVIQGAVLDLAESLQGSLLYLDAGAGEIAQTTLGLPFLFGELGGLITEAWRRLSLCYMGVISNGVVNGNAGLGVSHVCSLETATSEDSAYPLLATGSAPTRLAIFTTQLLTDAHQSILRAVLAHPTIGSVSVFSSVSEHAHACQAATELGVEAYREYAELLQRSEGRVLAEAAEALLTEAETVAKAVSELRRPRLRLCRSVWPSCHSWHPAWIKDCSYCLQPAQPQGGPSPLLPVLHYCIMGTSHLALLLPSDVAGTIAVRFTDIVATARWYCYTAVLLTAALMLLLALRSLSRPFASFTRMCGGAGVPPQRLLVRVYQPRQPGRWQFGGEDVTWMSDSDIANGVVVAKGPPSSTAAFLPYGQLSYESYGVELLDPTDRTAISRIEAIAGRPRRDALAALRRGLKEALRAEKLTPAVRSKAGAVQAPELRGLAEPLVTSSGACSRQRGVAALGLALADVMTAPAAAEWEAAAGLERGVLAALAGDGSGGGGGGGGCDAAMQVLLDAVGAARSGRGPLHVGHVLEILPAVFAAAADSESATAAGPATAAASAYTYTGSSGSGICPFSLQQQAALRRALEEAVLHLLSSSDTCTATRVQDVLSGRLPPDVVAALAARVAARQVGDGSSGMEGGAEGEVQEEKEEEVAVLRRRLSAALDSLFVGLRYASGARERLKTFRKVTHVDVFAENHGSLNPLLRQVVRKVLQRAEVSDWQQQSLSSGGGGGLVRGLLGGLMGASRALVGRAGGQAGGGQLPADYGTVLVFVVGGISAAEVREVRAELDEHVGPGKPRVLLGGTSLLLPQDVVLQLAGGLLPPPK
ncbi:hypothetical protein VOLCADRAFT_95747 [Volvox carteri f. nagariensis]|uniref:Sec1-like protein n=1 Tax=Volvox carteri f. nagariensis TaxID=3068 RepID=D8U8A1_VOLCA|nr:uncharacterized protein VOLCADRAFT_95747 [Volvox carteri f. nagariensis]EFJ44105.1 hypothetical protein VOLCADRAFT_95747 [Volvox carteri f. nagariensis]|eukprot:XP_002954906.1 hypothetical protein VOLCADRAFT_95747 [Volvox carteri f. nagariensis]